MTSSTMYVKEKPIFLPFLLLFVYATLNFAFLVYMSCSAVIFLRADTFFIIFSIMIYFFVMFRKIIHNVYMKKYRWRKWIFYILYYAIMYLYSEIAFRIFIRYVSDRMEELFLYQAFGAALALVLTKFNIIIGIQIIISFLILAGETVTNTKWFKVKVVNSFKTLFRIENKKTMDNKAMIRYLKTRKNINPQVQKKCIELLNKEINNEIYEMYNEISHGNEMDDQEEDW